MGGSSNRTEQLLHLAQVSAEKCELVAAREYYLMALEEITGNGTLSGPGLPSVCSKGDRDTLEKKNAINAEQISKIGAEASAKINSENWSNSDFRHAMEAISGLLRMADEAQDFDAIAYWENQLDHLMSASPYSISSFVWYCKGLISEYRKDYKAMQVYLHRALKVARDEVCETGLARTECEKMQARAWVMLARMFMMTGRAVRAQRIAEQMLMLFEEKKLFAINTPIYMIQARLAERRGRFQEASQWLKRAHASSVGEHNWYQYLYVLVNTARLNRLQRNYPQALWYLDLVDQATMGPEFARFKATIRSERQALDRNAADLVIDSRRGWVKTRESEQIPLRKQYILLNLLEELSKAHTFAPGAGTEGGGNGSPGLTKSELIERVWKERYRPQVHDNKLYYNINRLRKLIEPDMKNPQYLLSWREGYRLAPGLRIQWVQQQVSNSPIGGLAQEPTVENLKAQQLT